MTQERNTQIGNMKIHLHGTFVVPGAGEPSIQLTSAYLPNALTGYTNYCITIGWTDDDGNEQDVVFDYSTYSAAVTYFQKLMTEELFDAGDLIRRIRRKDFALRW